MRDSLLFPASPCLIVLLSFLLIKYFFTNSQYLTFAFSSHSKLNFLEEIILNLIIHSFFFISQSIWTIHTAFIYLYLLMAPVNIFVFWSRLKIYWGKICVFCCFMCVIETAYFKIYSLTFLLLMPESPKIISRHMTAQLETTFLSLLCNKVRSQTKFRPVECP